MADFIVTCPHCAGQFKAAQEWLGQTANCPNCGKPFIVAPAPPQGAVPYGWPGATPVAPQNVPPPPQGAVPYGRPGATQGAANGSGQMAEGVGCVFYILGGVFYIVAVVDFAGMFFRYDITGQPWTPILFGAIGQFFVFIANKMSKSE